MKKFFTLVASALMAIGANAQQFQLYTEVEENTYAVTTTLEEVKANFDAQMVSDAWEIGVALPAGYTIIDNDKFTMTAAVDKTPIYFSGSKCPDMQKEFPNYNGYMNVGSALGQNNWTGEEPANYEEIGALKVNNHGIFAVTPKVDGILSFGVYAGDNSRSIGIIDWSSEPEILEGKPSSFVAYNNFRNDGVELDKEGNVTVKGAPAYVEGAVKAGRTYLLVGGANKNLTLHQIKFVPTGSSEPQFQLYTEVEENTYAVTTTLDEVKANFDAQWVKDAWEIGVALPAGHTVIDNDKFTMTAAVDKTPVYFSGSKFADMQKDFPNYNGYMNVGSALGQNNWTGEEPANYQEIGALKVNNHGIFAVTPKVDGVLSFGVYAGDNSRSIGIIDWSSEPEILEGKPSSFVAYNNFRNDGVELDKEGNVTVKGAPAYVEGAVKAGRTYLLVGGANKNLTLHQVKFVPGQGTGIENVEAVEATKVAPKKVFKNGQIMIGDFNIAGQRVK